MWFWIRNKMEGLDEWQWAQVGERGSGGVGWEVEEGVWCIEDPPPGSTRCHQQTSALSSSCVLLLIVSEITVSGPGRSGADVPPPHPVNCGGRGPPTCWPLIKERRGKKRASKQKEVTCEQPKHWDTSGSSTRHAQPSCHIPRAADTYRGSVPRTPSPGNRVSKTQREQSAGRRLCSSTKWPKNRLFAQH